jgi:hypothetical protein
VAVFSERLTISCGSELSHGNFEGGAGECLREAHFKTKGDNFA